MYWRYFIIPLILLSCSSKSEIRSKAPYDGERFDNIESFKDHAFTDLLKWQWSRWKTKAKWPEKVDLPSHPLPPKRVDEGVNIVPIGHATVLIQTAGLNIITDPIYSDYASPVSFAGPKRVVPPAIELNLLPKIDAILISHNHYDHLDRRTLEKLQKRDNPELFIGLKNLHIVDDLGFSKIHEMDWWDEIDFKGVKIHFTPSQHWSARTPFDRFESLWGGFVIESKDQTIYFAGDTGYGRFFKLIAERFPKIDISLLPIGAYEPRWFMKNAHMNPSDAVKAFLDLGTEQALGIHFKTFADLTDEAIDQPEKDLKKALEENDPKGDTKLLERFVAPEFGKSYGY